MQNYNAAPQKKDNEKDTKNYILFTWNPSGILHSLILGENNGDENMISYCLWVETSRLT